MFDDLFGGIFGGGGDDAAKLRAGQIKADLLTRIRDLEEAAAGNSTALTRVQGRCRRHEATEGQKASFLLAWRKDLEMAGHHGLLTKEDDKEKGHHSLSAAYTAFLDTEQGYWEWALTEFKQAKAYAPHYWTRCVAACEAVVDTLSREPDVTPVAVPTLKELYGRFDVRDTEGRKGLNVSFKAQTPQEWMAGFAMWCENSVVFGDMIPDDVWEKAKAGEWKALFAYEEPKQEKNPGTYRMEKVRGEDGKIVMETRHVGYTRSPLGFMGSLMGDFPKIKWVKEIHESGEGEWKANLPRVLKAIWWGMGETPDLWERSFDGGKWFLIKKLLKKRYDYQTKTNTKDERTHAERRHKALHPEGHDGFDSEKELMRETWHCWIYNDGKEKVED
jgi:hypothetical protein